MKLINLAHDRAQSAESCRYGNESSHFIKAGIFLQKQHYSMEFGQYRPVLYVIVADMSRPTISSGPATDRLTLLCDQ
jgi:hypothetical protein